MLSIVAAPPFPQQPASIGPTPYVSQYQQQFRHLSSFEYSWPKPVSRLRLGSRSSKPARPSLFDRLLRMARRSKEDSKSSAKSAGQASSPQLTDKHNSNSSRTSSTSTQSRDVKADHDEILHHSHFGNFRRQRDFCDSPPYCNSSVAGSCSSPINSVSSSTTPEPDWPQESPLDRKKRELVDTGMAVFNQVFETFLAQNCGHTTHGTGSSNHAGKSGGLSASNKTNTQQGGNQKRQFSKDDSGDDHDDMEEGGNEDRDGSKRTKLNTPRFACPYFKHDPEKYRTERTCCGPGFLTVHRLKEHLFRRHAVPKFFCRRCFKIFKDDPEFGDHQRAETRCLLTPSNPFDGMFDYETNQSLRQLKSIRKGASEAEKWKEVYRILFPDELVPSPFYDDDDARRSTASKKRRGDDMADLEVYLRREFPKRVRRQLEREVEQQLNVVDKNVKKKAVEIFQGIIPEILKAYTEDRNRRQRLASPDSSVGSPVPRSSPPAPAPIAVNGQPQQQQLYGVGSSDAHPTYFDNLDFDNVLDTNDYGLENILNSGQSDFGMLPLEGPFDLGFEIPPVRQL